MLQQMGIYGGTKGGIEDVIHVMSELYCESDNNGIKKIINQNCFAEDSACIFIFENGLIFFKLMDLNGFNI